MNMKKENLIKNSILVIACGVMFASGCSLKASENSDNKQIEEVVQKDFNETIAVDMVAEIIPLYNKNRNLISISNITDFGEGYIFLMKFTGDGGGISLYYAENKDGKWIIDKSCKSEMAMSSGIRINTVVLEDKMIVYGDVGTYTYIPETDEQKNVDFAQVKLTSEEGEETVIDVHNDSQFLKVCNIFDVKSWSVSDKNENEILNPKSEIGKGVYENIKEMNDYI